MKLLATAFAVLLLGMPAFAACQAIGRGGETAIPPTPAAVRDILAVQRFTLETPYTDTWSKERARVSTGTLVVLEVDPAFAVPRETLEPVLYAGNAVVKRLNHGHHSGRVIGIVPGDVDLTSAPIWFGTPQLPERVTQGIIQSERALAERAGVRPFPSERLSDVERPAVAAKDLAALLRDTAAELVYEHSPQEKELADSWRLPVARAPSRKD